MKLAAILAAATLTAASAASAMAPAASETERDIQFGVVSEGTMGVESTVPADEFLTVRDQVQAANGEVTLHVFDAEIASLDADDAGYGAIIR